MIVLHVSKYFDRSSRTSSESRASESAVKPTRSANSTETSRRSETGAATSPPGPARRGAGRAPQPVGALGGEVTLVSPGHPRRPGLADGHALGVGEAVPASSVPALRGAD